MSEAKEYIVTEDELEDVCIDFNFNFDKEINQKDVIKDFLKSKTPVKKLDRQEVEKIIYKGLKSISNNKPHYLTDKSLQKKITAIYNLIPDFEIVFDNNFHYGEFMGDCEKNKYAKLDEELSKHNGKKIQIAVRVIK
jgi:hypothetical protein